MSWTQATCIREIHSQKATHVQSNENSFLNLLNGNILKLAPRTVGCRQWYCGAETQAGLVLCKEKNTHTRGKEHCVSHSY